jgi:hypothetical protein
MSDLGDRFSEPVVRGEWLWTFSWDVFSAAEEGISEMSSALSQPVLGGFVVDSNFGYLTGTDQAGRVVFEFPVNEAYGEDEDDPLCNGLAETWHDPERRSGAARALAAWSAEFAPREATAQEILKGMPGHGNSQPPDGNFFGDPPWLEADGDAAWVFAEDGLRFLVAVIGFDLDDANWSAPENSPESADDVE